MCLQSLLSSSRNLFCVNYITKEEKKRRSSATHNEYDNYVVSYIKSFYLYGNYLRQFTIHWTIWLVCRNFMYFILTRYNKSLQVAPLPFKLIAWSATLVLIVSVRQYP